MMLIDEMLTIADLDRGTLTLKLTQVDLSPILSHVAGEIASPADRAAARGDHVGRSVAVIPAHEGQTLTRPPTLVEGHAGEIDAAPSARDPLPEGGNVVPFSHRATGSS